MSSGVVSANELKEKIMTHLTAFRVVYDDTWLPKHHMVTHLDEQLLRHGTLISCWVHERKHKEVKRYGDMIDNTAGVYERTILESCLRVQLECLSNPESIPVPGSRLIKPVLASSSLAAVIIQSLCSINAVYVSRDASYGFLKRCGHSDLVVADINGSGTLSVCQVWFHVECGDTV